MSAAGQDMIVHADPDGTASSSANAVNTGGRCEMSAAGQDMIVHADPDGTASSSANGRSRCPGVSIRQGVAMIIASLLLSGLRRRFLVAKQGLR
eukprot:s5621_g3.t2